jgi:TRAP-type mannitol/chloroaromatic compound transport system substrate-binding protein
MSERMLVDRRGLLGIGAASLGAGLAMPAVARASGTISWKLATYWPKDTPGVSANAQRFAETIAALSSGRMTVQVFAADELVAANQLFDAVSAGKAEMGHGSPSFWAAKDPAFHYFSAVPFGLTASEHAAWLSAGGGQELWDRAYQPFGVIPLYAGSTGTQAAGWFRREIHKPEDFKDLTIRTTGLGAEVLKRLGANPVLLPPGDIAAALETGTIDAAEWVGPWNDLALNLPRAAPFCYMPAFHEMGTALELTVNLAAFDALPDDLRAIVRAAAQATATTTTADFAANNIIALPMLIDRGAALRSFPDSVIDALAASSASLLEEIGAASPMAREVHPAFNLFRKKAIAYANVAEGAAIAMRARALAT